MVVKQENILIVRRLVIVLLMSFCILNVKAQMVQLSSSADTICLGESVDFSAQCTSCLDSMEYTWYFNGDSIVTNTTGLFSAELSSSADEVSVVLHWMNNGIIEEYNAIISLIVIVVIVDAGPDIFADSSTVVTLSANGNATAVQWSPSFLVENPNQWITTTQAAQTTTYMLQGTLNDCVGYDYVTLFLTNVFDVPNTFSPNNDGINDTWIIPGIENFPSNYMIILNRFGSVLFEAGPYSIANAWTGTWNDRALPEGVYYFFLETGVNDQVIKGTISIVR